MSKQLLKTGQILAGFEVGNVSNEVARNFRRPATTHIATPMFCDTSRQQSVYIVREKTQKLFLGLKNAKKRHFRFSLHPLRLVK